MRIFPSLRRAANQEAGPDTSSTAIVRRSSSRGSQRSNIGQEHNSHPEGISKKWFGVCPTFKKNKKHANDPSPRISPYALRVNEELSPRSSAWLYMSAVSIACLSTFLVTEKAINEAKEDQSDGRSSIDKLLIVVLSISFALSSIITLSYRHRGLREKLTGDIRFIHSSFEFVMAFLMFCIWCIVLRYVTDPFSGLNYGLTMLTSDGYDEVWNTNIWVTAWLGWGLSSHLVGSLIMVSPKMMRGVWTRGFDGATSSRHNSAVSNDPTIPAGNNTANSISTEAGSNRDYVYGRTHTHGRGENSMTCWFMLLAFSSALAAFAIAVRTGDSCTSILNETPFCKRSSLGGVIGIVCAILAFAALAFHRMDSMGSFDHWAEREKIVSRVDGTLSGLSLVLHSVNMGYSTSPTGPSTEMGNLFIASSMGVILSLMLCEQVINMNVLRVWPIENDKERGGYRGNDDDDSSSSSSSSSYSSSSSSSSSSSESSSLDIARRASRISPKSRKAQDLETGNNETRSDTSSSHSQEPHAAKARKEFVFSKKKHSSGKDDESSKSSVRSSSMSSVNDPNNQSGTASQDTHSTYSLPEPPTTYSSSPSSPSVNRALMDTSLNRPFMETSYPPPPPMHLEVEDSSPEYQSYADTEPMSDDESTCDESGVELSFQPDDDVSTLDCSMLSVAHSGKEPDGYKSDDMYSPPAITEESNSAPTRLRSSTKSRKNWRQQVSSRQENRIVLAPVEEHMESRGTPKTSPNQHPKKTIEEIMNRGVDDKSPTKSNSTKQMQLSFDAVDESRVHQIARSFSQAARRQSGSYSSDDGPPTVDSAAPNDDAVNRALKGKSFYSEDQTMGDSGNVYSS